MTNRRRTSRWCVGKPIKVKLTGARTFVDCVLMDINFSGLQLALGRKLPQDSFRELTIDLCEKHGDGSTFRPLGSGKVEPSPGFLEVEVWVVWHKTVAQSLHIYGLYFSKIQEGDKEKIYRFVYEHSPQELSKTEGKLQRETPQPIGRLGVALSAQGEGEMASLEFTDRRIFARARADFAVRYWDLDSAKEADARMEDISAKGIRIRVDKELKISDALELWLLITDGAEPLYVRGKVAWQKELAPDLFRVGIRLEKADMMGLGRVLRAAA
jgi:hypothetical protein